MGVSRITLFAAAVALMGCGRAIEPPSGPEVRIVHKPVAMPDSGIEPPAEILIPNVPEVPEEIRGPSPPIDPALP
ncbi:MAG: hypothetical protein JW809_14440 [Pirellulales bacterium]|nr:hypothetical protein [Pirellulales bacterium]